MRKVLVVAALTLSFWLTPSLVSAHSGYYVSVYYGYPYWHGRFYGYYPPVWAYGWPPPFYYVPPPVYYAAPRERYCVQDEVYRYLPDGRIQWGTRTRCY
jgi:hypothetical protein